MQWIDIINRKNMDRAQKKEKMSLSLESTPYISEGIVFLLGGSA